MFSHVAGAFSVYQKWLPTLLCETFELYLLSLKHRGAPMMSLFPRTLQTSSKERTWSVWYLLRANTTSQTWICSASVHINTHHYPPPSLLYSKKYPSISKNKLCSRYVAGAFCVPQKPMQRCDVNAPTHTLYLLQSSSHSSYAFALGWTGAHISRKHDLNVSTEFAVQKGEAELLCSLPGVTKIPAGY